MPRYMRDVATNATIPTASSQVTMRTARFRKREVIRSASPPYTAIDCGRVPGRIARVDRQAFEAVNARAVRVHDERGRAVGRRLDGEREDEERDENPLAKERGHERQHTRDDRQHDPAGDDRADQRRVGSCRRAMGREPDVHSLVGGADAAGLDHVGDEQPEHDRQRGDHEQAAEHRQEEGDDRMAVDEPTEPFGEPAVARAENVRQAVVPVVPVWGAAERPQDVF